MRDFRPPLGSDRRSRLPILPILVVALPLLSMLVTLRLVQVRSLRPMREELTTIEERFAVAQEERRVLGETVERLQKSVAAMQTISKVQLVWGDSTEHTRVAFAYKREPGSSWWEHPREEPYTLYYYASRGDTLARIASHPRILGASYLWPILASENGLRANGSDPLPAGRLIKVPARLHESQIRRAIVEAGAPDKARDEIFGQAGITP